MAVFALSASDVSSVTITVTATDIPVPVVVALTKSGNKWGGTIGGLPAGTNRTFSLSALNAAGDEIYHGEVTGIAITKGETVSVVMNAQQTAAPTPNRNAAPVIDVLVASSSTIAPNGIVNLSATAHDPDPGDTLTYAWIASASAGTFGSASAATTTWTAPAATGTYRLSLEVTDAKGAKSNLSLNVTVGADSGKGSASLLVTLNTSPNVDSVTADPTQITAGATSVLKATASDSDGGQLAYAWSSDCDGTFSSNTTSITLFTLASVPESNACTFTVQVSDGTGGNNVGAVTIAAGPAPLVDFPPTVQTTYQSDNNAAPGETVTLEINAIDPNATALSFAWTASSGSLAAPNTTATSSTVDWTAPAGFATTANIDVAVSDETGQVTTETFTIQAKEVGWRWVNGPSLASNAHLDQCWVAPGNEVYVSAGSTITSGETPESWLYRFKEGEWSTAMHLPQQAINGSPVFGASPSDVFFATYECAVWGACGPREGMKMWHFDGSAASQMPLPNIGTNWIQSIRGETNNVYASYGAGLLRYNGANWSVVASGNSVGWGPLAYLGPNEIYTVGCWGYQAWNGATWANHPGFDFCDVTGVFGIRAGDGRLQLWAEGNNNFSNGIRAWQFNENPIGSMTGSWGSKYQTYINDYLRSGTGIAIWASEPNDFWVVGGYNNPPEGRIWRWNGTSWSRQFASTTVTAAATCVWGTSATDVWIVIRDGRLLHYGY